MSLLENFNAVVSALGAHWQRARLGLFGRRRAGVGASGPTRPATTSGNSPSTPGHGNQLMQSSTPAPLAPAARATRANPRAGTEPEFSSPRAPPSVRACARWSQKTAETGPSRSSRSRSARCAHAAQTLGATRPSGRLKSGPGGCRREPGKVPTPQPSPGAGPMTPSEGAAATLCTVYTARATAQTPRTLPRAPQVGYRRGRPVAGRALHRATARGPAALRGVRHSAGPEFSRKTACCFPLLLRTPAQARGREKKNPVWGVHAGFG